MSKLGVVIHNYIGPGKKTLALHPIYISQLFLELIDPEEPVIPFIIRSFFFYFFFISFFDDLFLSTLTIGLGGIVSGVDDQILGAVIKLATQVGLEDALGAISIALLGVERGSRHVRNHGVATTEGVLGVAQRVVLWRWLRVPHITTIAAQVTRLEGLGDIFLDDDGTTGSVDQPRA